MKIIMPGPIFSVPSAISESIDLFESCEDVQEAWVCHGNFHQQASKIHANGINGIQTHFNGTEIHVNGHQTGIKSKETMEADQSTGQEGILKDMALPKEKQGETEDEISEAQGEEGGGDDCLAESINIPVLEARLSVDISQALTRQKIASVQRGRTLSFADKEDSEDSPVMRARFFSHKDSLDLGGLPQGPPHLGSPSGSTPKMERSIKISRNPSYHSAVRVSPVVESPPTTKAFTLSGQTYTSSSEGTPEHDCTFASAETIHKFPAKIGSSTCAFAKNQPLDVPVAANMPRSASFSGGGILSPASPAIDSFRQVYGRRGSISQPSTPVTKRAQLPKPLPKEVTQQHHHQQRTNNNNNTIKFTRGSALTRSFRRLFSTPLKSSAVAAAEEYWPDTPEPDSPTPSEARSTSRLRKLSTNLTRKLSTRSKMSNSYTFPTGTNGHGINGEAMPDIGKLVDYEELMKLFSCSGCQSIMAPPLHQCRKGHLVCNTCKLSLKQVCPVCRQRFAETTNLMMEQVCHLVKFPCKWSNTGCPEFYTPKARQNHEHFCVFRPLHCHHAPRGCPKVILMRDMEHHLEECEYRDFKEK